MNHIPEEQLILHYYGETAGTGEIDRHLEICAECRSNYNGLRLVLNSVDSIQTPERAADYGGQVWSRIQPHLGRRRWTALFRPGWWGLIPATALLTLAAFYAGRITRPPVNPALSASSEVRERILLVAVGDHLERSQMVLAELSNAPDGKGATDISSERQFAEELLDDNRLYRLTARSTGDRPMANVLDDLERMLAEIAHSPSSVSPEQLEQLRREIGDRGLLFKVRVLDSQVRQREAGAQADMAKKSNRL